MRGPGSRVAYAKGAMRTALAAIGLSLAATATCAAPVPAGTMLSPDLAEILRRADCSGTHASVRDGRPLLRTRRTLLRHRTLLPRRRQLVAYITIADLRDVLRHLAADGGGSRTGGGRPRALVARLALPIGAIVAALAGLHAARTALRIDRTGRHRP